MALNATPCPICSKPFSLTEIENHVNKCLFLNGTNENEDMSKRRSVFSESQSPSKKVKNNIPQVETKPSSSSSATKQNGATFTQKPLAKQVEPKTLSDFIGQDHVVGEKTILRSLLEKCDIPNMILWGPPGCGKTSLSSVVRGICQDNPKKLRFVSMCATSCGVKDVQNVVATAKLQTKFAIKTVLFMDEIHRFNKKQQDIFLMHVEKGDITLIGATTENPSFTINAALLSRCRVIVFEKLQSDSLLKILENSLMKTCGNTVQIIDGNEQQQRTKAMKIEKSALEWLADISDGDARIALGNLQLVLQFNNNQTEKTIKISDIQDQIKKSHMLYDRKGEEHYNTISAMHKSIRGSDPNAALYWTTRMIVSGEDPMFIARRLVRAASEDIGNEDPSALPLAISTMQGCQLLGMPECDVLLAQCAIYLARAPKSREADRALANAKQVINNCKGQQPAVPLHLRNAPTKLMKELGYGKTQGQYGGFMPPELKNVDFFQ